MSFAQRRLWFIDQLQPGSPAYNVPVATRIRGPLDHRALHGALQDVVDRHKVLRTVYPGRGEEAVPEVLRGHRLPLPVVDLPDEAAIGPFYAADATARSTSRPTSRSARPSDGWDPKTTSCC
ncbi:condensation domain-containing protein [Streptosporangium lutulentum]